MQCVCWYDSLLNACCIVPPSGLIWVVHRTSLSQADRWVNSIREIQLEINKKERKPAHWNNKLCEPALTSLLPPILLLFHVILIIPSQYKEETKMPHRARYLLGFITFCNKLFCWLVCVWVCVFQILSLFSPYTVCDLLCHQILFCSSSETSCSNHSHRLYYSIYDWACWLHSSWKWVTYLTAVVKKHMVSLWSHGLNVTGE